MLASELPITQHLGITVEQSDAEGLTLRLPLAPNRNHQGTLFAGSLNAVATLAGWAVTWLLLRHGGEHAVPLIQDSSIEYLRPVAGDCLARCGWPGDPALARFMETLRRHARARITLEVSLAGPPGAVARFRGRYVALSPRES